MNVLPGPAKSDSMGQRSRSNWGKKQDFAGDTKIISFKRYIKVYRNLRIIRLIFKLIQITHLSWGTARLPPQAFDSIHKDFQSVSRISCDRPCRNLFSNRILFVWFYNWYLWCTLLCTKKNFSSLRTTTLLPGSFSTDTQSTHHHPSKFISKLMFAASN